MVPLEIKPSTGNAWQLRFEDLLVDISTIFINLPFDQIDSKIEEAQGRICNILDLDRSTLWQVQESNVMVLTHVHQPTGSRPPPDNMNARDMFPWLLQKTMNGETVIISKMADLPMKAVRDVESFKLYGAKSGVYVPLSVGQSPVLGVLAFATMREERDWNERVVNGFQLLAQVFSNALARKQAEMTLAVSNARLLLTTNAAGAGLWQMKLDTGSVWVSGKTRDLFHFLPNEKLNVESFFKVMHPEDHEHVNQAVQLAIQSRKNLLCEYRIVLPDGRIRWIAARGQWHPGVAGESDRLLGVSFDISALKKMEEQLKEQLRENKILKHRLEQENIYLQKEVKILTEHSGIVGQSTTIKNVLTQAEQVAGTDSTVLILGETGTGKELLARAIHSMSLRKDRSLVTINCASLPSSLIENELFGREKGAYTGAMTKMVGRFELADGSTLFLDEIGELPFELQSKLLRVLETGKFERLGSTKSLHINVRIIAATNRDLDQQVVDGKFRQDLFYRLNVFPIVVPPLRDRVEDIPLLVRAFVREYQKRLGKQIEKIPQKTMQAFQSYNWPGNVRELRNMIERAMILSNNKTLVVQLPENEFLVMDSSGNLDETMRREILAVLEKTRWRIAGRNGAAEILGLNRTTLYSKMKKLGIHRID